MARQRTTVMRHRARARWLSVHLWLGLTLGSVFVLLGLTGSALVFYRQIDGWLNPQVVVARQAQPEHSYQQILAAIHATHPQRLRSWRLEIPPASASNRAYTARYYFADEKPHKQFAPLMVTVNPYTAQVQDSRFWGETVMTFVYDLHYQLLLDSTGATLLGVLGIGLLVSLFTGVYLWWPRWRSIWRAITFKHHASRARVVYDIHKLTGMYGLMLLVVLAGTGVMLEKPAWFKPALQQLAPTFTAPAVQSAAALSNPTSIHADAAARRALQMFPHAAVRWLETPDGAQGVYKIRLQQPGEPSARFPQTLVWLDQYSGAVLAVRDAGRHSMSDSILAWLHPLHNGEAFGLIGRVLALIAGLLPLALFVTGYLRWQQKRRAQAKLAARA